MKSIVSVALIASFALTSAAFAAGDSADSKDAKDPDRMICKSEEQTGSRLARKKVCMTAAEWKESRRQQRMEVDRAQANNYKND
jgi:hypothetical protein